MYGYPHKNSFLLWPLPMDPGIFLAFLVGEKINIRWWSPCFPWSLLIVTSTHSHSVEYTVKNSQMNNTLKGLWPKCFLIHSNSCLIQTISLITWSENSNRKKNRVPHCAIAMMRKVFWRPYSSTKFPSHALLLLANMSCTNTHDFIAKGWCYMLPKNKQVNQMMPCHYVNKYHCVYFCC